MADDYSHLIERGLTQESVFRGTLLKIRVDTVALPNGEIATREIVDHPGAVAIVPMTASGDVLLVRQFRYPIHRLTLEIPAGKLEWGEQPEQSARRELAEEVGMEASGFTPMGEIVLAPGYSSEKLHMYLARGLTPCATKPDPDEFIETVAMPLAEALRRVASGEIQDAKTIIGLLLASQGS